MEFASKGSTISLLYFSKTIKKISIPSCNIWRRLSAGRACTGCPRVQRRRNGCAGTGSRRDAFQHPPWRARPSAGPPAPPWSWRNGCERSPPAWRTGDRPPVPSRSVCPWRTCSMGQGRMLNWPRLLLDLFVPWGFAWLAGMGKGTQSIIPQIIRVYETNNFLNFQICSTFMCLLDELKISESPARAIPSMAITWHIYST